MFKKFLPKQPKFFNLLTQITESAHQAAKLLIEILNNPDNISVLAIDIHSLENKCDMIAHTINTELNESFITPIDREDIFAITNALDDVVDGIDRVASKLKLYNLKTPLNFGPQLAKILLSQTELLNMAILNMNSNFKEIQSKLVSIRELETEGDAIFRDSISFLFENEKDIIELIKKKEILENFEKAVDKCQTATLAIEGALIKNM